jgi:hypothetical protein
MDTDNMYIELYDEVSDEVRVPLAFQNGKPIHEETRKAGKGDIEEIISASKAPPKLLRHLGIKTKTCSIFIGG